MAMAFDDTIDRVSKTLERLEELNAKEDRLLAKLTRVQEGIIACLVDLEDLGMGGEA